MLEVLREQGVITEQQNEELQCKIMNHLFEYGRSKNIDLP